MINEKSGLRLWAPQAHAGASSPLWLRFTVCHGKPEAISGHLYINHILTGETTPATEASALGSSPQLNTWNAPALPSTKFSRPLAAASASWGIKCWKNDSKLNSEDCSNFGKTDLSWIVWGSGHHLLLRSHYHVPAPRGIPEQPWRHPQPLLWTRNLGHNEGDNPLRFSRRAEE